MFFEAERQNFFRPLNGKRRELVAACIRSLYERLHGPGADYSQNLTRDSLRDVLMPAILNTPLKFSKRLRLREMTWRLSTAAMYSSLLGR